MSNNLQTTGPLMISADPVINDTIYFISENLTINSINTNNKAIVQIPWFELFVTTDFAGTPQEFIKYGNHLKLELEIDILVNDLVKKLQISSKSTEKPFLYIQSSGIYFGTNQAVKTLILGLFAYEQRIYN